MLFEKLFPCLIVMFLIPHWAYGQGVQNINPIKVEGITSLDKAYPGSLFCVAVIVDVAEGWHINAHSPSEDNLIPTELRFESKSELKFSEIIYPAPILKAFGFTDQKLAVYEGKAIIGARVSVSGKLPAGELAIRGILSYQACNDQMCLIPRDVELNIPIEVVGLEQPVHRINDEFFSLLEERWAEITISNSE